MPMRMDVVSILRVRHSAAADQNGQQFPAKSHARRACQWGMQSSDDGKCGACIDVVGAAAAATAATAAAAACGVQA